MTGSFRELLIWSLLWFIPMVAVLGVSQLFLSLPARRNERARLFLDLLETAVQTGQSPERAIVAISETRDRSVSVHFHLLASHIEEGAHLGFALERAPRLVPPNIAEVVKIATATAGFPQLIPAAREMLADANSRMRGAVNYMVVFLIVLVPAAFLFLPLLSTFVWPRLEQILVDMEVPAPAFTRLVFENIALATLVEVFVMAVLLFFAFFYIGGPRAFSWLGKILGTWPDRLLLALPWRRNRVHRDFTSVLAILLDAGLEESRSVELAASATANQVFQAQASDVRARLREGVPLPTALQSLESSAEFQWRWANALHAGKNFFACLRGWHESLEARAFQQEQAAAHVITSAIVLINGVLVAALSSAVFLIIISVIEEGTLW